MRMAERCLLAKPIIRVSVEVGTAAQNQSFGRGQDLSFVTHVT
jgi:hypothetical protein